jgi:regulatory protein
MADKPYISYDKALEKLQRYCAYQDRCHKEVRQKLFDLGVYGDWQDEIIVELITEKFLDEQRFANSFVRGKFRMKRWGKTRIKRELKLREISPYCIKKALQEIDESDYLAALEEVLEKKNKLLREDNIYQRKKKLAQHAIYRGFESGLVWEFVNAIFEK